MSTAAVFWSAEKSLIHYRKKSELTGDTEPFLLFLVSVIFVVVVSEALFHLGIITQFYLWEFKLDLKTLAIGVVCYVFNLKFNIGFDISKIGIGKWIWRDNLLAFFSPFFLLTILIGAGLTIKAVAYQGVDNPLTFLLATLFDVPATFFFSAVTVLMEEVVFRGFIFSTFSKKGGFFVPAFFASGLWAVLSLGENFHDQSAGLMSIPTIFFNSFSVGFVCSALLLYSKSIWSSYSFRIGILTFSAALLSRSQDESNTFFATNLATFSSHGIVLALLNFLLATFLLKLTKNRQKIAILE